MTALLKPLAVAAMLIAATTISYAEDTRPKAVMPPEEGAIDPTTIPAFGSQEHLEIHQKMRSEARSLCAKEIESKAEYGLRWTGWTALGAPYFNRGYFFNGHYALAGDNVEAQNAFGNWVPVRFGRPALSDDLQGARRSVFMSVPK
jgi:hypothetical protein